MHVNEQGEVVMSKDERRAHDAYRRCEQSPAWERVSAYVIIHPDKKRWGKIKVAHPRDGMGPLHAFLWDCEGAHGLQYGKASGCGYDKLAAALCGLKFDGLTFSDHPESWDIQLRKAGYEVIQAI